MHTMLTHVKSVPTHVSKSVIGIVMGQCIKPYKCECIYGYFVLTRRRTSVLKGNVSYGTQRLQK